MQALQYRFLQRTMLSLLIPGVLLTAGCAEETQTVAEAAEAPMAAPEIIRTGESRNLNTSIFIPAGAETLYLSGAGASPNADGSWGNMEAQTVDIFNGFRAKLEEVGWSMSDIVQVRVFAVAGPDGVLDFAGFNSGYQQFFGVESNPTKPVRTFVQIAGLVREGWLVEVEVRAARMPAQM